MLGIAIFAPLQAIAQDTTDAIRGRGEPSPLGMVGLMTLSLLGMLGLMALPLAATLGIVRAIQSSVRWLMRPMRRDVLRPSRAGEHPPELTNRPTAADPRSAH